jgi:hypothetical protein
VHPAVRGGVKGSQPFGGGYTPYTYINWGAKFLADSLMLEERLMRKFEATFLSDRKITKAVMQDRARPSAALDDVQQPTVVRRPA